MNCMCVYLTRKNDNKWPVIRKRNLITTGVTAARLWIAVDLRLKDNMNCKEYKNQVVKIIFYHIYTRYWIW